jgi:PAS domain-containing protein
MLGIPPVLATAVGAVRDLMEARLRGMKGEDAAALQTGLEELSVLWEEVQTQGEQIVRERQRLKDLFEFLPDACLITDVVAHIREANRAAVELLGVPSDRLAGKPLALFVAVGEREEFRTRLSGLYAAGYLGVQTWSSAIVPRDAAPARALLTVRAINPPHPSDLCWLLRLPA